MLPLGVGHSSRPFDPKSNPTMNRFGYDELRPATRVLADRLRVAYSDGSSQGLGVVMVSNGRYNLVWFDAPHVHRPFFGAGLAQNLTGVDLYNRIQVAVLTAEFINNASR